jgi:hypothetical protein
VFNRYVEQEGDANGVVRGSYAYLDPNHEWQKVRSPPSPPGIFFRVPMVDPPWTPGEAPIESNIHIEEASALVHYRPAQ